MNTISQLILHSSLNHSDTRLSVRLSRILSSNDIKYRLICNYIIYIIPFFLFRISTIVLPFYIGHLLKTFKIQINIIFGIFLVIGFPILGVIFLNSRYGEKERDSKRRIEIYYFTLKLIDAKRSYKSICGK